MGGRTGGLLVDNLACLCRLRVVGRALSHIVRVVELWQRGREINL